MTERDNFLNTDRLQGRRAFTFTPTLLLKSQNECVRALICIKPMLLKHAGVWTSAGFISDWCSEPVNAINGCCLGNLGAENVIQNFVNY